MLFAQPGCAVLRAQNYVTLVLSVRDESISLSLSGVTVISNLPVGRLRPTSADRGHASMGIAVCGRTRCITYLYVSLSLSLYIYIYIYIHTHI